METPTIPLVFSNPKHRKKNAKSETQTNQVLSFVNDLFRSRNNYVVGQLKKITSDRLDVMSEIEHKNLFYAEDTFDLLLECSKKERDLLYSISFENHKRVLDAVLFQDIEQQDKPTATKKSYLNIFVKIFLGLLLSVILFLFALNGRYATTDGVVIFDKWKKEWIAPKDHNSIIRK